MISSISACQDYFAALSLFGSVKPFYALVPRGRPGPGEVRFCTDGLGPPIQKPNSPEAFSERFVIFRADTSSVFGVLIFNAEPPAGAPRFIRRPFFRVLRGLRGNFLKRNSPQRRGPSIRRATSVSERPRAPSPLEKTGD